MLDKYEIKSGGSSYYSSNTTTTEYKAPTDDSVRLLKEMTTAARENVVDAFEVDNNTLKGTVIVFKEPMSGKYIVSTKFKLNGKDYSFERKIGSYADSLFDISDELITAMTNAIYEQLLSNIVSENEHSLKSSVGE